MFTFSGDIVVLILAVLGGIVWLVRLEGRVNTAEAVAKVVSSGQDATMTGIVERLTRIEAKQDLAFNHQK